MERITARSNPLLTHIRRLAADRGYRHECGEYLADSPKLLQEALLWDAELVNVVCGDGMELPPLPAGVRAVQVPPDVMAYGWLPYPVLRWSRKALHLTSAGSW